MGKLLKVGVRKPTNSLKATKKLPLKCKRVHEFKAKLKKNIKNNKGQLIKPVSKVIQGEPKSTTREILDAPAARNLTLQSSGILDTPAIGPVSHPCKKEKKKETQKQDADAGQATTQNPYPKTIEGLVKELNDLKGTPMSREKKIHKNALRSLLARMKKKEERRRLKAAMKLAKKQKQVSRLSHTSSNVLPVVIDTVGMDMKEVNEKKETVQRKKILSKTNVTKSSKSTKNKTSSGHFKERKNNQKQEADAGRATCRKPYPKTIEGLVKELNELKEPPMSVEKMFRKNGLTNRLVKKRKKEERKAKKAAVKLSKQQNLVTGLSHTNGNTIEKENKKQDGDEGQATTQKPYPKTIEELVQELNKLKGIPKSRENILRMKGIENKLSKKKNQEKRKIKRAAIKLAKKQNQDTGLSLINRKDNQKQDAEGGQATSQKPYPKTIEGLVKELNELKGIPMSREKKLRKNALRSILARMKKKEKIRTKRVAEKLANKQKLVSGLSHTNSNVSPSTIDTKGINIKEDNDKKEKAVHSKQILSQINVPKQSKLTTNKISRRNKKGNLNKNSLLQKTRLKKSKNLGRI